MIEQGAENNPEKKPSYLYFRVDYQITHMLCNFWIS
jgi:hypothetical protein